jgi:hypothetical protein
MAVSFIVDGVPDVKSRLFSYGGSCAYDIPDAVPDSVLRL